MPAIWTRSSSLQEAIRLHASSKAISAMRSGGEAAGRASPRCRHASRRRKPCRPLDRRPGAFVQTNVVGTSRLLEARCDYWRGAGRRRASAFRFHHVSTDEVFGSLGAERHCSPRRRPTQPNSPYSASKAASDHLVRAWHAHLWAADADHQLLEQLRAVSFPGKADPADDPQGARRRAAAGLRQRRQRPRLAVRRGSRARSARVLEAGRLGETYNIGGNAERDEHRRGHAICALLDARRPLADGRARER